MDPVNRKKRILLIHCGMDKRQVGAREECFDPEQGMIARAPITPLACVTLAALTPDQYEVDIWDEDMRGQIQADTSVGDYDIIGVSLIFSALAYQARFLGLHLKKEGTVVVAGGPGISSAPEEFRPFFDALFVNEAERTWPQFLRDYEQGNVKKEYRQIEKPELSESPAPKWSAIEQELERYEWASVQTTRGCPFDCEFCDVIYLFGRKQRHKSVEQVVKEVKALEGMKARGIFFADDEFVGDAKYTKKLLEELIGANNGFARPLRYFTQATLTMSRDERLLELMADVNFYAVLVGIESFNASSLKETHKYQNLRADLVGDLRKIQSYGVGVRGSFIVGFDHDGPEVFDTLFQGAQQACLPWPVVAPLQAVHNTPLWVRLRAEGRIATLRGTRAGDVAKVSLNIIPQQMSRAELLEGYHQLVWKLYDWEAACARIRGWVDMVQRRPRVDGLELDWKVCERFLDEALRTWELSERDMAMLRDTLEEIHRAKPYMLGRVLFFLVKIHSERKRYGRIFQGFDEVLAAERAGGLVRERRPLLIPSGFGSALTGVFPELYARLYQRLPEKALVPEALRAVLVDFLLRWGESVQQLEPQHRSFLFELCDRTVERLGGTGSEEPVEELGRLLSEVRKSRLLDAVLKDVRDELSRMGAS